MLRLASSVVEALDCDVDEAWVLRHQMGCRDARGTATVPTKQSGHVRLGMVELAVDLGMAARASAATRGTGLFCHWHTVTRRWVVEASAAFVLCCRGEVEGGATPRLL